MTALSHSYSFVAGTPAIASEINSNFASTRSIVNGQLADDNFAATAGVYTAYRTLLRVTQAAFASDLAAGTYFLQGLLGTPASSPIADLDATVANFVYLDDADFAISGRNTRLRVRGVVSANATQPTITFTFGLYPVTFAGAADAITATLGTVVTSSTAAVVSPAASASTAAVSSDVAVPSDGIYALGVVTSAQLTNNNSSALTASLDVHWT